MQSKFPIADVDAAIKHELSRLQKAANASHHCIVGIKISRGWFGNWIVKGSLFHHEDDNNGQELFAAAPTLGGVFEAAHRALPRAIKALTEDREAA
jgi:hypothetical protein